MYELYTPVYLSWLWYTVTYAYAHLSHCSVGHIHIVYIIHTLRSKTPSKCSTLVYLCCKNTVTASEFLGDGIAFSKPKKGSTSLQTWCQNITATPVLTMLVTRFCAARKPCHALVNDSATNTSQAFEFRGCVGSLMGLSAFRIVFVVSCYWAKWPIGWAEFKLW